VALKIHPQIIIEGSLILVLPLPADPIPGWRRAVDVAHKALEDSAIDNSKDQEKFREDLMNIARTTLSSKILKQEKDHFAKIALDAVLRLKVGYFLGYLIYCYSFCFQIPGKDFFGSHPIHQEARWNFEGFLLG